MEVVSGTWQVVSRTFGPDVYSGTAGIALFLGRLYATTQDPVFRDTARAAIAHAVSRAADVSASSAHSLMLGRLGIALVLLELAEHLGEPALESLARKLFAAAGEDDISAQLLDLLGGSAGAIEAALRIHAVRPGWGALELAIQHAERLLASAIKGPEGVSWDTMPGGSHRNLTGLTHGAAGIGCILLELYGTVSDRRYLEAGLGAFRYENRWFDHARANWPDFRILGDAQPRSESELPCGETWCHGAPGILLARLRAWELLRLPGLLSEVQVAAATTLKSVRAAPPAATQDASLCHGLLGNLSILGATARALRDSDLRSEVLQGATSAASRFELIDVPWQCGVPGAKETPGYMLGLAGIGSFLLTCAMA